MAEYRKKLEADIRCPLEYGLWWQMEIAYYMRAFRQQKTALQRDTERNVSTGNHMMRYRRELSIHLQEKEIRLFRYCRVSAGGQIFSIRKMWKMR